MFPFEIAEGRVAGPSKEWREATERTPVREVAGSPAGDKRFAGMLDQRRIAPFSVDRAESQHDERAGGVEPGITGTAVWPIDHTADVLPIDQHVHRVIVEMEQGVAARLVRKRDTDPVRPAARLKFSRGVNSVDLRLHASEGDTEIKGICWIGQ